MRVNGYQCDGCGAFEKGDSGDQREPGPFMPKGWSGSASLCLCVSCTALVRNGILKGQR